MAAGGMGVQGSCWGEVEKAEWQQVSCTYMHSLRALPPRLFCSVWLCLDGPLQHG